MPASFLVQIIRCIVSHIRRTSVSGATDIQKHWSFMSGLHADATACYCNCNFFEGLQWRAKMGLV